MAFANFAIASQRWFRSFFRSPVIPRSLPAILLSEKLCPLFFTNSQQLSDLSLFKSPHSQGPYLSRVFLHGPWSYAEQFSTEVHLPLPPVNGEPSNSTMFLQIHTDYSKTYLAGLLNTLECIFQTQTLLCNHKAKSNLAHSSLLLCVPCHPS